MTNLSFKHLMIRNPKDFGVWSACPSGVHSVITQLAHTHSTLMAPLGKNPGTS